MKKTLGIVLILGLLLLGSYYITGMVTERTLKNSIRVFEQNNGISLVLTKYHRGWFKSDAALAMAITVPEHVIKQEDGTDKIVAAENFDFDVPLAIFHGPIIFAAHHAVFGLGFASTQLQLPASIQTTFTDLFAENSVKPVLDLEVLVNYLNKAAFKLSLPSFKLLLKSNGAQFDWLGLTGDVNVTPKLNSISGSFDLAGARFSQEKLSANLGQVSSVYDINKTVDGLYTGSADLNVPSLLVLDNEVKQFELTAFDVHSDSAIQNDLFNSNFKTSFDKLDINGKTYGPGILELSIYNLDEKALAQINQQSQKIKQASGDEKQQAMLAILPQLPKLVSQGAKFEISKLNLAMPEGNIKGNLVLSLTKTNTDAAAWLDRLQGQGKIEIPIVIVKEVLKETLKHQEKPDTSLQEAMVAQLNTDKTEHAADVSQSNTSSTEDLDALTQKKLDDMIEAK